MQLRIGKMEAEDNFIVEVTAAAAEAGEPENDDEPEQLAIRLAERLDRADRTREAKANLVNDLQRLQDARGTLDVEIAAHERRKNEVLGVFGVTTLSEVVQRDELLRDRDRLRAAVAELEEQLLGELAVEGAVQARSILDAVDCDRRNIISPRSASLNVVIRQVGGTFRLRPFPASSAWIRKSKTPAE